MVTRPALCVTQHAAYLFVCGLFNNVISSTDHVESNNKFEVMRKGAAIAHFERQSENLPGGGGDQKLQQQITAANLRAKIEPKTAYD
jgi:hypothetical protein